MNTSEKLQKVLAQTGLGSRRTIERWIAAGIVRINECQAKLGDRVLHTDRLYVRGEEIKNPHMECATTRVLVYNKPEGVLSSTETRPGVVSVFTHLPPLTHGRWVMVGRLDLNSAGLILFTNQGELAYRLMHPKYQIEREYKVRVLGSVTETHLKRLQEGVVIEGGPARFEKILFIGGKGANTWYQVVLREGRNREVRRLWQTQGLTVSRLIRTRFGQTTLPHDLPKGQWRDLPSALIHALKKEVGLV